MFVCLGGLWAEWAEFEIWARNSNLCFQDGAECHRLIFLFSDGGIAFPADVVAKYSNSSRFV